MTTKTPAPSRNRPARPRPRSAGGRPRFLLVAVVAAILGAALAALILAGLDDGTAPPEEFDLAEATVDGASLPPYPEAGADPAVGQPAPQLRGEGLDGEEVVAPAAGRPTVLLFAAHWCPHCQAEVPEVQEWLGAEALPDDVDLVTVSTGVDAERPNYPPSAWLHDEGWSAPTLADGDAQAATVYGLSQYPFWAAVDAEGNIVARQGGRLSVDGFDALVDAARHSA